MWWRVRWKWVVLWSVWAARLVRQPTAPVQTSAGTLRGQIANDGSHVQYLGVPYAVVGHRFKASKPQPKWEGTFEAVNQHIKCSQRSPFFKQSVTGREDCLVLNVYTPLDALLNQDERRPVMVFIHGGGFRDGSGSPFLYGPNYLVKHNVILVTINYRLEVLGFLCLKTKDVPGNAGLKDQVEALKWVKENIRAFGGDPDNVTIFGESAGSASVMYHLLSPMSQGLFHKAILQSGSAMSPWSFQFEPLKYASLLTKKMGYDSVNTGELNTILTRKSAEELLHTRIPRKKGDVVLSENIFVPCVEDKFEGVEQFLPDLPYNLVLKGVFDVPIMMGYNSQEGFMFAGKENYTTLEDFNYYKSIPRDLNISTEKEKLSVSKILEQLYNTSENKVENVARFEGDSGITFPVTSAIDLLSRRTNKPLYAYKFSYDGWMNLAKFFYGFTGWPGATHADELFYIFKTEITLLTSFLETEMVDRVTSMWTNFAKYGSPTPASSPSSSGLPRWRPLDPKDPSLLVIDSQFSTTPLWGHQTLRFWNQTYTKYRRKDTSQMLTVQLGS